jgi:hypothetical protein
LGLEDRKRASGVDDPMLPTGSPALHLRLIDQDAKAYARELSSLRVLVDDISVAEVGERHLLRSILRPDW